MENRWIHSSNKQIILKEGQYSNIIDRKPNGLWCAKENTWKEYAQSPNARKYDKTAIQHMGEFDYQINLKENSNIIIINNDDNIINFTKKYAKPYPWISGYFWQKDPSKYNIEEDNYFKENKPGRVESINWIAVAKDYDAIILDLDNIEQKFIWSHTDWKVSSLCIFNTRIIESLVLINEPKKKIKSPSI